MSAAGTARSATDHLDRFCRVVRATTGINLSESKRLMIEARLRKRLTALNLPTLDAYFAHLFEKGGLEAELPHVVEVITTNKTDFFREPDRYALLDDRLIPEAIAEQPRSQRVRFRLWSAAASTGAEAWSAAMLLHRAAQSEPRFDWAILGTDITRSVLETARRAVYPERELAPVPPDLRRACTMTGRGGRGEARARIVPELRARVRFAPLNLLSPPYAVDAGLDVIFLRNVLIYFERETQARVIDAVADHLRPGGHLIVGHSESMIVQRPGLSQRAPGVFRLEGVQR
ncbi:CheR family methyltransferase [Histidinibacterium aquaticum]|uniref:Chemotaxis protein methyltransferase n=1 Tax=Histidinibacterium aquaticum TaxID=2613962 RepID=A0A5J5GIE9_9RHOB|nr:CheR family methyltransferase [Histidinibacterium aquaticum]KAA9008006.1 chemotaxis protein CheR [Histidinibacterium aquaticum]